MEKLKVCMLRGIQTIKPLKKMCLSNGFVVVGKDEDGAVYIKIKHLAWDIINAPQE